MHVDVPRQLSAQLKGQGAVLRFLVVSAAASLLTLFFSFAGKLSCFLSSTLHMGFLAASALCRSGAASARSWASSYLHPRLLLGQSVFSACRAACREEFLD